METKQNGVSVRNGKSKGSAKWERRVSRKFYEAVCGQIREVSALNDEIDAANVIACLDEYIDRGQAQPDFSEMETVVFTLLQPQIDKALQRSRRARAAAVRRREARMQSEALAEDRTEEIKATDIEISMLPVPSGQTETAEETEDKMLSREAKRARRREEAAARRLMKHRKRLERRGTKTAR